MFVCEHPLDMCIHTGRPIYQRNVIGNASEMAVKGSLMFNAIREVVILEKLQRTKHACKEFKTCLQLVCDGKIMDDKTDPAYNILKQRFSTNVDTTKFKNATHVWYCRQPVRAFNVSKLRELGRFYVSDKICVPAIAVRMHFEDGL